MMKLHWAMAVVLTVGGLALAKEDPSRPHVGSSQPPMAPLDSEKKFVVPPGFEVRLFAAEPDVVNPVAMTWDEKGRLWVVELYEYPNGAKPGEKGRDRVKVYWDTDGDERADKSVVFCDGLSLATAVLVGDGGVYVGQAPHLYFYPIVSDGPGGPKAGERKTVLTGFGLQDRHELLNSFVWGPDGQLYMTHGVFTHSVVKDPDNPNDDGIVMNAAVARFDTRNKKFELFSDGISNQWGVDWDAAGNAFVSACVVEHIWHIVPGGVYIRQGGTPTVKHTYELLPSINKDKHRHFMAAYGGINLYQGNLFPEPYRGTVFMGNIHGNCIDHDKLTPDGASFRATDMRKPSDTGEFLEANDDWFRPVNEQVGPDGALWVMDWYDKYPCYQNAQAPDLDRSRGRIWRVVYTGDEKGKKIPANPTGDLSAKSDTELVELLTHPNIWQRRTAQRLLSERKAGDKGHLVRLMQSGEKLEHRLAALWTLYTTGQLSDAEIETAAKNEMPPVRAWAGRFIGERAKASERGLKQLQKLASDKDPTVRSFVAYAARRLSEADTLPIITTLLNQPGTEKDPVLPFMIWMAAEAKVAKDAKPFLNALKRGGSEPVASADDAAGDVGNPAAQRQFIRKVMRRLADTKDPKKLDEALAFLNSLDASQSALAAAAIDGLLDSKQEILPASSPDAVLAKLQKSPDRALADRANRLAALWGNAGAAEAIVAIITDEKKSEDERLLAVNTAKQLKTQKCKQALIAALSGKGSERFKLELVRALGEFGGDDSASAILKQWKSFSPDARRAIAEVMASRLEWAIRLLYGVQGKTVATSDIPITAVRTMWQHDDSRVVRLLTTNIGPFRESSEEKLKLIAQKKQAVLNGPVDFAAGQEVFARTCQVCHTLYGAGNLVGPDLTGVGRSSIDALLAHVIDPSQIIGKGYENTVVETKDGQLLTGRLTEESDDHVKLLAQGAIEHTVRRNDIRKMRTENLSVMPEGLEDMPEQDFRSLIWYVFAHPEDERIKRLMVEPRDKQLVVKAKLPGSDRMVELLTYVIDPNLRPYLHPVRDPSATVVLTEDRPADHPWQHGIFTGLHKVNGLDFWSESKGAKSGSQHFVKVLDLQETMERVSFRTLSEWRDAAGNVVLEEEHEIAVHAIDSSDLYRIDFEWLLRAKDKPVKVGRHDYGGFSVRMKTTPQHAHINSNGQLSRDNAPQSASWCNVSNPYGDQWFGIAVLDHPENFRFPSTWRVDGQGLINPSPSIKGDWQIDAGKERAFHYRLIIHRGKGEPKILSDEHLRWAPPVQKIPVTAVPPPN